MPARDLVTLMVAGHDAGLGPVMLTEVDAAAATGLAASAAMLREGMRLGTAIVPLGSRTSAALAMEATTVAALSGTEFLLGVGVSSPQIVSGWHDTAHDPSLATTRRRVNELRQLLDGERRGAFGIRDPAGRDVRILLGTLGPKMRALADEVADGVIVNLTPPAAIVRPPADRRCLVMVWTLCSADAELSACRELVSYALSPPYAAHLDRLGYGAVVREVERLRSAGRLKDALHCLPDDLLDAMFTTLEGLPERVAAYRRAGAHPLVLPVTSPSTAAVGEGQLIDEIELLIATAVSAADESPPGDSSCS